MKMSSPFQRWMRSVKRNINLDRLTFSVLALQLIVFGLQWHTLEKTDRTLKAELRAWLGVTQVELLEAPDVGKLLNTSIKYENFGKEPATSVDFKEAGSFTASVQSNVPGELVPDLDSQCSIDGDDADGRATGETCGARIRKEVKACHARGIDHSGRIVFPGKGSNPLPIGKSAMRANINTEARMIFVTGCFTYYTLERPRYSSFCYFYRGGQSEKIFRPCPIGNEAN